MYNDLSKVRDKEFGKHKWAEALADAQEFCDASPPEHKRQWLAVMGTIRQAIEREEPWPAEEEVLGGEK